MASQVRLWLAGLAGAQPSLTSLSSAEPAEGAADPLAFLARSLVGKHAPAPGPLAETSHLAPTHQPHSSHASGNALLSASRGGLLVFLHPARPGYLHLQHR